MSQCKRQSARRQSRPGGHPPGSSLDAYVKLEHARVSLGRTQDVIDAEYEGFLEWILYSSSCADNACKDASCGDLDGAVACARAP